jgi:autotransporter passenger strand-loop-strand repeat protein
MPTYTGTLTGSGEFVGTGILSGVTEDVSQSDDVTAELVFNSNGTFTGTEDQVFTTTVTINFPGEPSSTTTSTDDTGAKPVSGNVNKPYITTITANGNTITTTWIFSVDHSTIHVSAIDKYNSTGISGGYDLGGTLSLFSPPPAALAADAQTMFGTGNYVYLFGGSGTSLNVHVSKSGAVSFGLGIDCSHMVWESLLGDGYSIPYLSTAQIMNLTDASAGTLTTTGSKYYSSVDLDDLQAGDILMFVNDKGEGHTGIVQDYVASTGVGHFFGSQNSTGPASTSFTTDPDANPSITFGNGETLVGAIAPNSSYYSPTAASKTLNNLTSQATAALDQLAFSGEDSFDALRNTCVSVDPINPQLAPEDNDTPDQTEGTIAPTFTPNVFKVTFPSDPVDPGWSETVSIKDGAIANVKGATLTSGSIQNVSSGGTAINTSVGYAGAMMVSSGGLADPAVIGSGGSEIINAGGTDDGAKISGGVQFDYGLASGGTLFAGTQVVESGASASGTMVKAGGVLAVQSGGVVTGAVVSAGGLEVLFTGGSAAGTVNGGGTLELVGSNPVATAVTFNKGGVLEFGSG